MKFTSDRQRRALFARLNSFSDRGISASSRYNDFIPVSKIADIRRKERADTIYSGVVSGIIDSDDLSADDRQLFNDTQERLEKEIYDLRLRYEDDADSFLIKEALKRHAVMANLFSRGDRFAETRCSAIPSKIIQWPDVLLGGSSKKLDDEINTELAWLQTQGDFGGRRHVAGKLFKGFPHGKTVFEVRHDFKVDDPDDTRKLQYKSDVMDLRKLKGMDDEDEI